MNGEAWGLLSGGLGLFLLGMKLMSDGLRTAAGESLRRILQAGTKTTLRGMISGASITAMVQSSSAVTVATIGFVNAGLLNLTQAIGVIYGSNVGTTMTGWLVSLIGLHISIKALAMPLIGIGALFNLISKSNTRSAIGQALAGFGLFFLGIDFLKQAFDGLSGTIDLMSLADGSWWSTLQFVGIGIVLTFLMQSSSATIAITLTATAGGMIPLTAAAAMVIGANVGTTTTALLAVIGATSNARRVALAHVAFNVMTGLVALLLLPLLLHLLELADHWLGITPDAAITLALFHTLFNILGIALMWPLTPRMVRYLEGLFHRRENIHAEFPQYLDANIQQTPSLAMDALRMELLRTGEMATRNSAAIISAEHASPEYQRDECQTLHLLVTSISKSIADMRRQTLSEEVADCLPIALEIVRYHQTMGEISCELAAITPKLHPLEHSALSSEVDDFRQACANIFQQTRYAQASLPASEQLHHQAQAIKKKYRQLKQNILHAGVDDSIGIQQMVLWLDHLRLSYQLIQQADHGNQAFHRFTKTEPSEPDTHIQ